MMIDTETNNNAIMTYDSSMDGTAYGRTMRTCLLYGSLNLSRSGELLTTCPLQRKAVQDGIVYIHRQNRGGPRAPALLPTIHLSTTARARRIKHCDELSRTDDRLF